MCYEQRLVSRGHYKRDRIRGHLSIFNFSFPVRNGNGVTGKLSRGNKLPDGFLDRSRWEWLLQEKSLQGG
jgi:hypothetical protein